MIKFNIRKWKEYGNKSNKRRLSREETKTPMVAADIHSSGGRICPLDNNQLCTPQIWPLWKSGKNSAVAERKKSCLEFAKSHVGDTANVPWSDETKITIFRHSVKCYVWQKPNTPCTSPWAHHLHSETWWWQHHAVEIILISRYRESGHNWGHGGCSQIQWNLPVYWSGLS